MSLDIIPAPDVFVNASITQETAPDHVLRRLLSEPGKVKSTEWILQRVASMLVATGHFKEDRVDEQMGLIRGLVDLVPLDAEFDGDDWAAALQAAATASGVSRVLTDHPDLLASDGGEGTVQYVSSEAWLVEQTTPPPMPGA